MLLLAEDLLLLLTDDTSGRLSVPSPEVDVLLVGANLVELTLMGKVDLSREMRRDRFRFFELGDPKWGRIIVHDPSPTGDEVLDATLEFTVAYQGRLPPTVIFRQSTYQHQKLYWRPRAAWSTTSRPGTWGPTGGRFSIPPTGWRCADE